MRTVIGMVVITFVAVSCAETPSGPTGYPEVRTDADRYAALEPIRVTLENDTDTSWSFGHCDYRIGFVVEELQEGAWSEWSSVDGPVCIAILPTGLQELEPQDSYERVLIIEEPGRYRIRFDARLNREASPAHQLFSSPFEIEPGSLGPTIAPARN